MLYLNDSYLREFDSAVVEANDKYIVLKETAFYPNGGGQPYDTGILKTGLDEFKVVYVGKFSGRISHEVDKKGLKKGDKVHGIIDWERRHRLMRMHTAAHIISAVFHKEAKALITGNQLDIDKGRIDYNIESFDRQLMDKCFEIANEIAEKDLAVNVTYMSREDAEKDRELFKLAKGMPDLKEFRIVSIGDFDKQADGGTHVKSTKEVGKIEFVKAENKGKNNRRVYFSLR